MEIITSVRQMQQISLAARAAGKKIAFVPTMGFLHEGHASLLREGRKRGDVLVLSIFVNPTQFGVGEDFERYPRDLDADCRTASGCGVDLIFCPPINEMYPPGYQTFVEVEEITRPLCGAVRPGHFRGVATVVTKLFNIVMPDTALFGEKDFQQLAVIRRMAGDLNMSVEIIGMPIVREPDGLAMSSRNSYLSPDERRSALCLSRALELVSAKYNSGVVSAESLKASAMQVLNAEPSARVEYLDFRDQASLQEVEKAGDDTLVALAVKIGKTRLIDNTVLGKGFPCREKC